jgi:hypothetical protein
LTIDNSCPLGQRGQLEIFFCHGESRRDEIFYFWIMGMTICEFRTVMETIKTVSVDPKRGLGSEVDCRGNHKTVSVVSKRGFGMAENAMSDTLRLELAVRS